MRSETRDAIVRLSERRGISAGALIEELVAREEENELLDAMNEDFGALRQDDSAWGSLTEDRAAWEETLLDGLTRE